jgi:hypothetical protein
LDFQVNGKTYYLGLAEDSREWLVLESTETGARPIPVYVDAPESEDLPRVKGKKRRKIVQ